MNTSTNNPPVLQMRIITYPYHRLVHPSKQRLSQRAMSEIMAQIFFVSVVTDVLLLIRFLRERVVAARMVSNLSECRMTKTFSASSKSSCKSMSSLIVSPE